MPAPSALIPQIEGMIATLGSNATQVCGAFVDACKYIMRRESLRDETDWQFQLLDDVDESANAIADATDIYAALIETDSADAETDWVVFTDASSNTFDGTAALDNTDFAVVNLPAAATDGTPEYHTVIWLEGINLPNTGVSVGADGQDGTNPAADDIRVWLLYRN